MKIFIKNMVSIRCKMLVKSELEKLRIPYTTVELGEVETEEHISAEKREQLKEILRISGLELMDDKRAMLIEQIKKVIIEAVHYSDEFPEMNFSDYLAGQLHEDYTYLANIFSQTKGITIEHYMIFHKIEKVKELLIYDKLNLTQIAQKLNYSSTAHLSNQFKKVTGLTPTFFKSMKYQRRLAAEDL